jgi:nucleotide-binding universal stress UspA family protein
VPAAPPGPGASAVVVHATPARYVETKEQAVERVTAELRDYLQGIAGRMPSAVPCRIEAKLDDDPRAAIIRFAREEQPDMIVMATHGRTGLAHVLFGNVAEGVLRSGVAPVLLVHPPAIARARQSV